MFLYICQTETTNLLLTNMKKLFTLAAALLLGASAFAQNQGDMAVKATTFFSYYNSHNKALDISMDGTNFAIGAGFTYFVIDNLGVSLDATYATGNTVALTPSVSYFIPIASNFYYTPTLGLNFVIQDPFTFGIDLSYIAFEYRLNDLLAFDFTLGNLTFDTNEDSNDFSIGVNTGGNIGVRFYL